MIKKLMLEKADRIYHLPPVIDDFLPRRERKKMLGQEILDLARFKWPESEEKGISSEGLLPATEMEINDLKEKTAEWYRHRFGVKVKPLREIFIGDSVRQTLGFLSLAFFNPGDVILVPEPGVWHYRAAAVLASTETVPYHLSERNRFRPTLSVIADNLSRMVKAMVLNSPHNPTGATLSKDDYAEILRMAGRDNILLILDHVFEGFAEKAESFSIYGIPGGRKVALELYSFAYNFGQPFPSLGFAIGQPALISGLKRTADIFGHTVTRGRLQSALKALDDGDKGLEKMRNRFSRHRDLLDQLCRKIRLHEAAFRNGPYYWAKLPGRKQSRRFARTLYLQCGILTVPGTAFGDGGEGYLRFSLTAGTETYEKALKASGRLLQVPKERKKSDG